MRQGIYKTLCHRMNIESKFLRGLLEQLIVYTSGPMFVRQSIVLGHFLCDRVQGVKRFSTQPRHWGLNAIFVGICYIIYATVSSYSS